MSGGNFVSLLRERIEQAKEDWKQGRIILPPNDNKEFIPLPDYKSKPAGSSPGLNLFHDHSPQHHHCSLLYTRLIILYFVRALPNKYCSTGFLITYSSIPSFLRIGSLK